MERLSQGNVSPIVQSFLNEGEIVSLETPGRDSLIALGTFEAPRFMLRRGHECKYHCHLFRTIGVVDTGLVVTLVGEQVYLETHRKGKVKKPFNIQDIGEKEKADIIFQAQSQLSEIPEKERRKPSKKAILLILKQQK